MPVAWCFSSHSFVTFLEPGSTSTFVLLLMIALDVQGLLRFYTYFKISFTSVKNVIDILTEIALTL